MVEPLSTTAAAELREQLERKRAHLVAHIAELEAAQQDMDIGTRAVDQGDMSVDRTEWERERIEELEERTRLEEVEHALAKFAAGSYGLCEQCGRPIPLARLRIIPEARYDTEHQAALEARIAHEASLAQA
jgi:DnaK suppressor protein